MAFDERGAKSFAAPWGTVLKLSTGLSVAILAAVFVIFLRAGIPATPVGPLVFVILGIVMAVTPLFAVTGYDVTPTQLNIRRLGWSHQRDLKDLERAFVDREAMRGSLRLFGNGGFFSFSGIFWSRKLGRYRAFVTDSAQTVVLKFRDRCIVISPEDPEAFVRALPPHVHKSEKGGS